MGSLHVVRQIGPLIDDALTGRCLATVRTADVQLLAKLARQLPAEAAHQLAVETLRWRLGPRRTGDFGLIDLTVTLGEVTFLIQSGWRGFDKNAACYQGALRLGFGHVELVPLPVTTIWQSKPRCFA